MINKLKTNLKSMKYYQGMRIMTEFVLEILVELVPEIQLLLIGLFFSIFTINH